MLDNDNVVRVVRYIKVLNDSDPVTRFAAPRIVGLDWGIGDVNGGSGYYVYGPPSQIFAGVEGGQYGDSHVLYTEEILPLSQLPSTSAISISGDQYLHFKYPNV